MSTLDSKYTTTAITKNNIIGGVLPMVLLFLMLLLGLVLTMNKYTVMQQSSASIANDYSLAQNYARNAMYAAEQTVYEFDLAAGLENPSGNATISTKRHDIIGSNIISNTYNIQTYGASCNKDFSAKRGWCYSPLGQNFGQDPIFQPANTADATAIKPCNGYDSATVLMIDDKTSNFSIEYQTTDTRVCAQPRYILEPISLDYRGDATGRIVQQNGAFIGGFTSTAPSARIYRITVRAFGRSGNTRVMYQEYVGISDSQVNLSRRIIPLSMRWIRQ